MSNSQEKVRELAKLSILSDRISEFHKKNMEAFPQILFTGFKEAAIEYDLKRGNKNYVNYNISLEPGSENTLLEKRLETLDKCIKNLFWKEVSTSITLNGKKVFNSEVNDLELPDSSGNTK